MRKKNLKEYVLKLYVTGSTERSLRAIENLNNFVHSFLDNRADLEIIDIYKTPEAASEAQIIAAPTLVKTLPLPLKKLVGDLSQTDKILLALDVKDEKTK